MNWLLGFLRELSSLSVNLADVVDVLVVTLLLYALLVLLRGTRAMQMLWGILIITGLYFFSRALDLITLSTILGNLLAFLPIAIIVLFQREIRSMLAAFGSRTLLRWKSEPDEGTAPLNELALGVQALASKRIGALIAIERKDSLAAWADTGIPLDAIFSYDLMLNIFIPGTPLHDGAVVLRGSKIVAASCFLPLTTRHRLSSELGTRHRAAIGLTEESDALVIVVSEETGTISLAVEEQLLRPLDETTLRNALAEHALELAAHDNGKT